MLSVIIEASEDNTLDQLHRAILDALRWDEDHLYSFFMSGKAWDRETEYFTYDCEDDMPTLRYRDSWKVKLKNLGVKAGDRFLYLFDYGDRHEFDIEILGESTVAGKRSRPVIAERSGTMPQQYPPMDD
jgi:hypothetical protein